MHDPHRTQLTGFAARRRWRDTSLPLGAVRVENRKAIAMGESPLDVVWEGDNIDVDRRAFPLIGDIVKLEATVGSILKTYYAEVCYFSFFLQF